MIYLDQARESKQFISQLKIKCQKHKSGYMVGRLKVETKKAKSVLRSNSKL